jgi:tetratricopeptide (TPR) repeat protein
MMLNGMGVDMRTIRGWLAAPIVIAIVMAPGCKNFQERALLKKGNSLYTAQKYEEAIQEYAKLLQVEPNSWDGNYLTAVSYLALYHPGSEHPKDKEYAEKGIAAFERTLELTPPTPEAREKTERYYLSFLDSTGEKDKAIAYLEKQLASRPSDLALINQIATLYQKKGDFTKALEYFEKRANMDPTNKETWYTLGVNCWARSYHGGLAVSQEEREQVVDKGIMALDKALAIDPNYFDALSYINLIYREKAKALATVGKNAEAGQAYAKADEYQKQAIDVRKAQAAKAKSG